MHEMSIAVELMNQLEPLAVEHRLERIESITVQAGVLRGIVPEALDLAFATLAEGTAAEGAQIDLRVTPARAKCRRCGEEFEPRVDEYLCPACGQADVELLAGNEVLLMSIEGKQV
jgi:hydrogenase nickel incorporation protein HypA/HybF